MQIDYLQIVVLSVCAITFYRAGKLERSWGVLWAALSIAVSLLSLRYMRLNLIGVFLSQGCLFVAITIYRICKKE